MIRVLSVLLLIHFFAPLFAQKDLLILDRISKKIFTHDIIDPVNGTLEVFADQNIFNSYDLELNRSNGDMFWSNGLQHTIMKANVASPNNATVFYSDTANAIIVLDLAIDSVNQRIYWLEGIQKKLFRANLDGSNVVVIPTVVLANPAGLVVSPTLGKIYYSDIDQNKIWSANLDGSQVEIVVSVGTDFPVRLALAENLGKLYWADDAAHKVFRINLDGSNVETVFTGGNDEYPYALAVDEHANKLYWSDYGTSTVHFANLDGSDQDVLITGGLAVPIGLAIRGGFTTGIVNLSNNELPIQVHPNPASQTLSVETDFGDDVFAFDMFGRQFVHTQGENGRTVLNVSTLPEGHYVVVVVSQYSRKFARFSVCR